MDPIEEAALFSAVSNVVGKSRAFIHEIDAALHEIGSARDPRTERLLEAIQLTVATPDAPGTIRYMERAAAEVLRALRTGTHAHSESTS